MELSPISRMEHSHESKNNMLLFQKNNNLAILNKFLVIPFSFYSFLCINILWTEIENTRAPQDEVVEKRKCPKAHKVSASKHDDSKENRRKSFVDKAHGIWRP